MGGFGSGDWADVMTRKVNTSLCRTLSVKRLKTMGVFDDDQADGRFSIRWVNEFGEDAEKVTITHQVSGNGNKRSLRVEIGGSADASGGFVNELFWPDWQNLLPFPVFHQGNSSGL